MSTPQANTNFNPTRAILAAAVGVSKDGKAAKAMSALNFVGLLRLRAVRWLLGIDCKKLQKDIQKLADKTFASPVNRTKLVAEYERLLEHKWKVGSFDKILDRDRIEDALTTAPPGLKEKLGKAKADNPKVQKLLAQLPQDVIDEAAKKEQRLRTVGMDKAWKNEKKVIINGEVKVIINDTMYHVLTSDVSSFDKPIVSRGSQDREQVLLDPNHSPLLMEKYSDFQKKVDGYIAERRDQDPNYRLSPERLAILVNEFMREGVFPMGKDMENQVNLFVKSKKNGKGDSPCIPIDDFIQKGIGVCRHHSLVAAFMMDRFMNDHKKDLTFAAKVQVMRDEIDDKAAHAWVSFVTDEGQVLAVDTLNNFLVDLTKSDNTTVKGFRTRKVFEEFVSAKSVGNQLRKAKILREKIQA